MALIAEDANAVVSIYLHPTPLPRAPAPRPTASGGRNFSRDAPHQVGLWASFATAPGATAWAEQQGVTWPAWRRGDSGDGDDDGDQTLVLDVADGDDDAFALARAYGAQSCAAFVDDVIDIEFAFRPRP